jgi:hypothetical protein
MGRPNIPEDVAAVMAAAAPVAATAEKSGTKAILCGSRTSKPV